MKIVVGMSGGVDSTVAAYLLKKEGHEVIGVNFNFVNNTDPDEIVGAKSHAVGVNAHTVGASTAPERLRSELVERSATKCPWGASPKAVETEVCESLKEVANRLSIKIISRDYHEEFYDKVITSFVRDYESGITPNPCALCNRAMKFEKLLEVMREVGADMVATGHYANICKCENTYCIQKSNNSQKDQSYMLYRLSQDQLSHIIFPLGNMDKSEVRKIAESLGLSVANKKDSQDVCFIQSKLVNASQQTVGANQQNVGASTAPERLRSELVERSATKCPWGASPIDYKEFIKEFELGSDYKEKIARGELNDSEIEKFPFFRPGEFVDTKGNVLGYHKGIINYTIGQRRGIDIAFGERKFVVKIDVEKNQVVLGDNEELYSSEFRIYDIVLGGAGSHSSPLQDSGKQSSGLFAANQFEKNHVLIAKLRYRHDGTMCDIDFSSFDMKKQMIEGASRDNFAMCHLHEPVRAITRGQAAVFYDENENILFGGRIDV